MKVRSALVLLLALLCVATIVQAAGYAIWEMGTRSSAMGGVMTATPNDPTAIFYNPAGLVRLDGRQVNLAMTNIKPYQEFSGAAPSPGYGVTETLDDPIFFLPQAFFSQRINSTLAAGLAFYTPYGLSIEWADPENYSGRHIATKSELHTYFLSPTVSFAPSEKFSLGVGLNVVWSSVELNQHLVWNLPDPTYVGEVQIAGDGDMAYGYNVGALFDIAENTRVGLSYKSKIDLDFSGDADFTSFHEEIVLEDSGGETSLPLPSLISLGVATQVHEKLLLEFNFNRIQWSAFEVLKLEFTDLDEVKEIREEYINTSQYRFGAEYQALPELALRGGFVLDRSPQPSGSVGPVLPDSDRTGVSLGAGYTLGDVRLDIYNLFLFFEDREITDNFDGYNGKYRAYTNLFGLGLNWQF